MVSHVIDLISSSPLQTTPFLPSESPTKCNLPARSPTNPGLSHSLQLGSLHDPQSNERRCLSPTLDDHRFIKTTTEPHADVERRRSRTTAPPIYEPLKVPEYAPPQLAYNARKRRRIIEQIEFSSPVQITTRLESQNLLPPSETSGILAPSMILGSNPAKETFPDAIASSPGNCSLSNPFSNLPSNSILDLTSASSSTFDDVPATKPRDTDDWVEVNKNRSRAANPRCDIRSDSKSNPQTTPHLKVRRLQQPSLAIKSQRENAPDVVEEWPRMRGKAFHSDTECCPNERRSDGDSSSNKSLAARRGTAPSDLARQKKVKQEERARIREKKAREKVQAAALLKLNKSRTDKKVSTPEMVVDLPSQLAPDTLAHAQELLEGIAVEHTVWSSEDLSIVKWRRKVTSRFNSGLERWEPISPCIHDEKYILAILPAEELVSLVEGDRIGASVRSLKETFPGHTHIMLVQDFAQWSRKNRNSRNRQFSSNLHQHVRPDEGAKAATRTSVSPFVSQELIDEELLRLQVEHNLYINHCKTANTAKWIVTFTQQISTIPYRRQRDLSTANAAFCMETGQVCTGDDCKDTYIKMLQEIARVTAPIAHGVAAVSRGPFDLVRDFEANGVEWLAQVKKYANKDGHLSDRTVGPAVSRRLHRIFTIRDETSVEI